MATRYLASLVLAFAACAASSGTHAGDATGPRFVVYYNSHASPASSLIGLPYTHVILSFITTEIDADGAIAIVVPEQIGPALKDVSALQADGKKVLISFGGGDMKRAQYLPLVGREKALAAAIVAFVAMHGLDGVDIDFEISDALYEKPPSNSFDGRAFLLALTKALRTALPKDALVTHVPQAPYLDPAWHGGPYIALLREAGDLIDWITVQYYNSPEYNDPVSKKGAPGVAAWTYAGIVDGHNGISWPPEKTLVGKPIYSDDASNGYVPPGHLLHLVIKPLVAEYGRKFGGVTGWQFSTLTSDHRFWNMHMASGLGLDADGSP